MPVLHSLAAFWHDERGQDLIEYGLLTGIVGITMILALGPIAGKMETSYNSWNTASQDAWEPCPPVSSGLPCP
jgi:Flp pilus assembly pilin Flp